VTHQLLAGVPGHRLHEAPLGPALRHPESDRCAAAVGQEGAVGLGVLGELGHEDLAGNTGIGGTVCPPHGFARTRRPAAAIGAPRGPGSGGRGGLRWFGVAVELLQDPADQLGQGQVLHLVHDEGPAAHDPAPSNVEDTDGRLERLVGDADHVEILGSFGHHLLPFDGHVQGGQLVASTCRALEVESIGGLVALAYEPPLDLLGGAGEETHDVLDVPVVLLALHGADARTAAALDVVHQTGLAQLDVTFELGVGARPDGERPQEKIEGVAQRSHVGVGTEVADPGLPPSPHHGGPGPGVGEGDGHPGVALVVDQTDVEPGPVLLDEGVLEKDGLDLASHLDPLHPVGGGHHLGRPGRQGGRVDEVIGQPAPQ